MYVYIRLVQYLIILCKLRYNNKFVNINKTWRI